MCIDHQTYHFLVGSRQLHACITNNSDLTPTSVKLEELSAQTQRGIAPLNFNWPFLRLLTSICFNVLF